ncbi:MAG: hypothetical protein ACYTBJ_19390 [Planctomycetota bacterium]|jgi:hypothetical protein
MMEAHVFQLDTPYLGQTHGRISDKYENAGQDLIKVVIEYGTMDGGKFVLHPGVKTDGVGLTGLELDMFLDEPVKQGATKGNYRNADLGQWLKVGKDARLALVEAERIKRNPPEEPAE